MKKVSFPHDVPPLKNQIFRLALRITLNREEAEDSVQDTLMKLWDRRDAWDQIDNLEAFSYTICRNLALDRLKKLDNNNQSLDAAPVERPDTAYTPSEKTIQQNRVDIVRKLVDSLPEKQRSCIQLRDFEGKTYKEIAQALQISEDQVKVNIHRGRQTLREKFQEIDNYGL